MRTLTVALTLGVVIALGFFASSVANEAPSWGWLVTSSVLSACGYALSFRAFRIDKAGTDSSSAENQKRSEAELYSTARRLGLNPDKLTPPPSEVIHRDAPDEATVQAFLLFAKQVLGSRIRQAIAARDSISPAARLLPPPGSPPPAIQRILSKAHLVRAARADNVEFSIGSPRIQQCLAYYEANDREQCEQLILLLYLQALLAAGRPITEVSAWRQLTNVETDIPDPPADPR